MVLLLLFACSDPEPQSRARSTDEQLPKTQDEQKFIHKDLEDPGSITGIPEYEQKQSEWQTDSDMRTDHNVQTGHDVRTGHSVQTGLDVLAGRDFDMLEDRRVGLITNATGVNADLVSIVDILHRSEKVDLVALFGPEHGVRGDHDAGVYVESYLDERTGIPVYSLYGLTRKPTKEMLEGIDVLVYDIQDIGVRSYTYISTLGLAMEAAAEQGIAFLVLDRPNPLGGIRVEGNIVEEEYLSFVSPFPIPYIHGLTIGELAVMINEEGMLSGGVRADLNVVTMENWKRGMIFEDTGLYWVPTSPHIPHSRSPFFYVATGLLGELHVLSEGVGYTLPFEIFGAGWIDANKMAAHLNEKKIPDVLFRPVTWKPFYGRDKGKRLQGVQIHITDYSKLELTSLGFRFLEAHHELYPDKNPFEMADDTRIHMFDRVSGTSKIRELFTENMRYADVRDFLDKDVASFRERSQHYRLYE